MTFTIVSKDRSTGIPFAEPSVEKLQGQLSSLDSRISQLRESISTNPHAQKSAFERAVNGFDLNQIAHTTEAIAGRLTTLADRISLVQSPSVRESLQRDLERLNASFVDLDKSASVIVFHGLNDRGLFLISHKFHELRHEFETLSSTVQLLNRRASPETRYSLSREGDFLAERISRLVENIAEFKERLVPPPCIDAVPSTEHQAILEGLSATTSSLLTSTQNLIDQIAKHKSPVESISEETEAESVAETD